MLTQYLDGKLNGVKLDKFQQSLFANHASSFAIEDFSRFDLSEESNYTQSISEVENQLDRLDFFFKGQLIRREKKAQKKLYRNLYPKVKKHILQNSGGEEDAKDLTQEVIIKLYEKLKVNSAKITTIEGFVFGILRNVWLKELEKRKRIAEKKANFKAEQATEIDDSTDSLDESSEDCRKRILKDSLQNLRPPQREFLNYYDLNDHSIKETAVRFKMDENSVKVRANRCRKYLKKQIAEHPDFPYCFQHKYHA